MAPAGKEALSARPLPIRPLDTLMTSGDSLEAAQEPVHAQCRIESGTILITNPLSCAN